ncbi:helix-turn-helix domain-containing protein [Catellatospora bangladeshensis]|uniref:helix-turn-helix domain-containing protein n=1 Tax=Catellatospora bangladeshensis TaxID=310355 RepID=UPI00361F2F24
MLDTSARLLRLLSLLPTRAAWTGPELAERLDVTGRTLRRDIARLRELGYPVQATPGSRAVTGWAPGRCCRRCCWRTTRRWRWC